MFAGSTAPAGWLICDGRSVSSTDYPELYAVIGTTYGGYGTNFQLPDLRGRFPVGKNSGTFSALGGKGGEEKHAWHDKQKKNGQQWFVGLNHDGGSWMSNAANDDLTNQDTETGTTGSGQPHNILPPYVVINYIIKS